MQKNRFLIKKRVFQLSNIVPKTIKINEKNAELMDGQTDEQTDRRTDNSDFIGPSVRWGSKNNCFVNIISLKSKHNCDRNGAKNLLVKMEKQVSFQ